MSKRKLICPSDGNVAPHLPSSVNAAEICSSEAGIYSSSVLTRKMVTSLFSLFRILRDDVDHHKWIYSQASSFHGLIKM